MESGAPDGVGEDAAVGGVDEVAVSGGGWGVNDAGGTGELVGVKVGAGLIADKDVLADRGCVGASGWTRWIRDVAEFFFGPHGLRAS